MLYYALILNEIIFMENIVYGINGINGKQCMIKKFKDNVIIII